MLGCVGGLQKISISSKGYNHIRDLEAINSTLDNKSLSNWSWRATKMFPRLIFGFCFLLIINSAGASYRWSRNIFFFLQQIQKLITKLWIPKFTNVLTNSRDFTINNYILLLYRWVETTPSSKFKIGTRKETF